MGWFDTVTAAIKNTSASRGDPTRTGGSTSTTDTSTGIHDNLMDWASQQVPPPPPTPPGDTGGTTGGGGTKLTLQQIADQMRAKYPAGTVGKAAMDDLFNTLQSNGYNVARVPHGGGYSADKFTIDGKMYDFASGADSGTGTFWPSWSPIDESGGSGITASGETGGTPAAPANNLPGYTGPTNLKDLGVMLGTGDLAEVYGETFKPPAWAEEVLNQKPAEYGQTYTPPDWVTDYMSRPPEEFTGEYKPPEWTNLGPPEEWKEKFVAPTAEEVRQTPGYQFNLSQGLQGMDTGAAARGTLLSTGNQKDRLKFATGLADTYYGEAYGRALGEYQQAYGIFRDNQDALYGAARNERTLGRGEFETNRDTFFGNADLRRNAATTASNIGMAGFNTNYGVWRDQQAATRGGALDAINSARDTFTTNADIWRTGRNDVFGRFRDLATLGLTGADRATS